MSPEHWSFTKTCRKMNKHDPNPKLHQVIQVSAGEITGMIIFLFNILENYVRFTSFEIRLL